MLFYVKFEKSKIKLLINLANNKNTIDCIFFVQKNAKNIMSKVIYNLRVK